MPAGSQLELAEAKHKVAFKRMFKKIWGFKMFNFPTFNFLFLHALLSNQKLITLAQAK